MNVLITGGAGFIGSHIAELFLKKKKIKKVVIIDNLKDGNLKNIKSFKNNKKIQVHKCDILNKNKISKLFKKINVVIHLAAMSDIVPSIEDPINYLNTNIMGTVNILECMRKNNVNKIIYAASSSCYGIPKKIPTDENSPIDTRYPYAFSKYVGELVIKHWSKVYNIKYVSLRLFNVYGTRSRTHGSYGAALGVFLKQKINKKPFTIVGNGRQKRDFVHVSDVSDVFYKCLDKNIIDDTFNIGYGIPHSINYLTDLIKGKKIYLPKRPGEPDITHADIDKSKKKIKWRPHINLKSGIKDVLKNIDYWKNATLWDKKSIKKATKNWFKYLK